MKLILASLFLFSVTYSEAQSKDEIAIKKILTEQVTAWNEGNLEKFMAGYWKNDSLLFVGKSGPKYGYDVTLENYKKGYPDTAHMGKFTSTIISMKRLSSDHYFVVGKWFLQRSVGDAGGYYTLLFRKINGQWVIIADHSS
ncbi:YybH family protein [Chitinophagaceae bacterium LWZ2-11]